jgi:hypothetical protein
MEFIALPQSESSARASGATKTDAQAIKPAASSGVALAFFQWFVRAILTSKILRLIVKDRLYPGFKAISRRT